MNNTIVKRSLWFYLINIFLLFFYLYQSNLAFMGVPEQLHSMRLAAVGFLIYAIIKLISGQSSFVRNSYPKSFNRIVNIYIYLFIFSLFLFIIYGIGDGENLLIVLLNYILFGLPVLWAFTIIYNSLDEFMFILFCVGVVQSVIVLSCILYPPLSYFLDATFNLSANDNFASFVELRENYAGGLGCITSSGVVKFVTGIIASIYLYLKSNKHTYLLSCLAMMFISTMIARTGLLFAFLSIGFLIYAKMSSKSFTRFAIGIGFVFVLANIVSAGFNMDELFADRFLRYSEIKEDKGAHFLDNYFHHETTSIPELGSNLFLGCGMISGKSRDGVIVNVDGGYLRLYSAAGLVVCLIFYYILIKNMIKVARTRPNQYERVVFLLLVICLLIGEFKEPIMLTTWPIVFFGISTFLSNKQQIEHESNSCR